MLLWLVRILLLSGNSTCIINILKSIRGHTAIASISFKVTWTVNQLLWAIQNCLIIFDNILCFNCANSSHGPVWTTRSLITNSSFHPDVTPIPRTSCCVTWNVRYLNHLCILRTSIIRSLWKVHIRIIGELQECHFAELVNTHLICHIAFGIMFYNVVDVFIKYQLWVFSLVRDLLDIVFVRSVYLC